MYRDNPLSVYTMNKNFSSMLLVSAVVSLCFSSCDHVNFVHSVNSHQGVRPVVHRHVVHQERVVHHVVSAPSPRPVHVVQHKPAARPKPVVEHKPAARPKPVVQHKPAARPKPVVQHKPAARPKPVVQHKPSAKVKAEHHAKPEKRDNRVSHRRA